MALEKQIALIAALGDLGESIPGLDPTPIIKNMADKSEEIKNYIIVIEKQEEDLEAQGMTKAEAKAEIKKQIKELIEAYKKQIETMVKDKINEIKTEYKKVKDAVTAIPEDISAAIAAIALPPAIGVPPVAPNPLYALIIAKQAKHSLQSILNIVISSLVTLLKAATAILFEVPDVVLGIGATITVLAKVLNTIPG